MYEEIGKAFTEARAQVRAWASVPISIGQIWQNASYNGVLIKIDELGIKNNIAVVSFVVVVADGNRAGWRVDSVRECYPLIDLLSNWQLCKYTFRNCNRSNNVAE